MRRGVFRQRSAEPGDVLEKFCPEATRKILQTTPGRSQRHPRSQLSCVGVQYR